VRVCVPYIDSFFLNFFKYFFVYCCLYVFFIYICNNKKTINQNLKFIIMQTFTTTTEQNKTNKFILINNFAYLFIGVCLFGFTALQITYNLIF
jgi:Ca2+/Na+ antiporter